MSTEPTPPPDRDPDDASIRGRFAGGLAFCFALAAADVLFGGVLLTHRQFPPIEAALEWLASLAVFGACFTVAGVASPFLARISHAKPRRIITTAALLLCGAIVIGPLIELGWYVREAAAPPLHAYAMALVLFVPFMLPDWVARASRSDADAAVSVRRLWAAAIVLSAATATLLLTWAGSSAVGLTGLLTLAALLTLSLLALRKLHRQPATLRAITTCCAAFGLAALAGSGLPAATQSAAAASRPSGASTNGPRHVLLLTVDTLRADALRTYAASAPPTPNLDALAADSIVFERAISPAPWTLPAFTSILTGLSPLVHEATSFTTALPRVFPTLAQRMRAAGYQTAAIGYNPFLSPVYQLDRGFGEYVMYPRQFSRSVGGYALATAAPRHFGREADNAMLTDLAIEWLAGHQSQTSFLWLHYFDPHMPYEPRPEYMPPGPPPPRLGNRIGPEVVDRVRSGHFVPTREEIEWMRALYDAEVRDVDANIGRLLASLRSLGLYDDTLIVFASDHGEEFWEHGGFEHGHSVYDELLHVPLFIKPTAGVAPRRLTQPAPTAAITPTILDLCGIDAHETQFSQRSLARYWQDAGGPASIDPIVSTACAYYEDQIAIRSDGDKYIRHLLSGGEELFDVQNDPAERCDLLAAQPERYQLLRDLLAAFCESCRRIRESFAANAPDAAAPDGGLLRTLQSLGYVE